MARLDTQSHVYTPHVHVIIIIRRDIPPRYASECMSGVERAMMIGHASAAIDRSAVTGLRGKKIYIYVKRPEAGRTYFHYRKRSKKQRVFFLQTNRVRAQCVPCVYIIYCGE